MRVLPLVSWLAVLLLASSGCRTVRGPGATSGPLARIHGLEDQRSLGGGSLQKDVTTAPDPQVRVRALLALARIQAASTADTIAAVLGDANPEVRSMAAFAAGELGLSWEPLPAEAKALLTARLLEVEAAEQVEAIRVAQLEALGRLETSEGAARLVERLADPSAKVSARAALALAMPGRKGGAFAEPGLSAVLARGASVLGAAPASSWPDEVRDDPRYAFAYALAVTKKPEALEPLVRCLRDPRAEVRAVCAKGLADVGAPEAHATLLGDALLDSDPRAAAEAARALAKLAAKCTAEPCPAAAALEGLLPRVERVAKGDRAGGNGPLLALAQSWSAEKGGAVLALFREKLRAALALSPPGSWDLARLDCRFAAAQVPARGTLDEVLHCGDASVPESYRLALGVPALAASKTADPKRRIETIAALLDHPSPAVKEAALSAVASLKMKGIAEKIRPLILSPDPYVGAYAALAAAELGDREALPQLHALALKVPEMPDLAEAIADALLALGDPNATELLHRWLESPHAHVRQLAAKRLSKLQGTEVRAPEVARTAEPVRPVLEGERFLRVKVRGGELKIRLWLDDAPLTAQNLHGLARKGYFKNLTFHRIVPDFVVQGGDPHGDGEGGPGYTIRCEINRRLYERGTVGMALSGKDTGGSQLFIATAPQPHLDGRYTTFGEVVSGLELVDGLLEGEPILDVIAE